MKLNKVIEILNKIREAVPEGEDPDVGAVIGAPEPFKPCFELLSLSLGQGPNPIDPRKQIYQVLLVCKDPTKELILPKEKKLIV